MIRIPCDHIYYNTQVYFRRHYLDLLPNDQSVWAQVYRDWLAKQGCHIEPAHEDLITNSLGIAPFHDNFVFQDSAQAMIFMLRWS